jgi:hypothetical protein
MTKKGWLSGSSSDDEKKSDATTDATARTTSQQAQADDVQVPHRNIIDDARNPETDDGSVNPHNEAMAQKPVAIPLDQTGDNTRSTGSAEGDLKDKFRAWGRRLRLGGPNSADWEEFERLTGDRPELPKQPEPAPSVPEAARSSVPEGAVSSTTGQRAETSGTKPQGA